MNEFKKGLVTVGLVVGGAGLILAGALWLGVLVIEKKPVELPMELANEASPLLTLIAGSRDRLVERRRVLVQELEKGEALVSSLVSSGPQITSSATGDKEETASLQDQFDRISTSLSFLLSSAEPERSSCKKAVLRLKEIALEVTALGKSHPDSEMDFIGWTLQDVATDHEKRIWKLTDVEPLKKIQAALSAIGAATREMEKLGRPPFGATRDQELAAVRKRYQESAAELKKLTEVYYP